MAGVTGAITISLQLTEKHCPLSAHYVEGTTRAPESLRNLVNELNALKNVFATLRDFAATDPAPKTLDLLNGPLLECCRDLENLQKWLVSRVWHGRRLALQWSLRESEILQRVTQMEQQKMLFSLAMTSDYVLLAKTLDRYVDGTRIVLRGVRDVRSCVRDSFKQKEQDFRTEPRNTNHSSTLARSLHVTYHQAIALIRQQPAASVELALAVLSWLSKAQRTLTVPELATAVSVVPGLYSLSGIVLPSAAALVAVCGGLVAVDACSGIIRLSHATVGEFLLENAVLPIDADVRLAIACITYLSFDTLADGAAERMEERVDTHPFLTYAAGYVTAHLRACPEERTTNVVLRFLQSAGAAESYIQAATVEGGGLGVQMDGYSKSVHALHIAADIGHVGACRALLEQDTCRPGIEAIRDREGRLALHVAARRGYIAVARLLLEKGADLAASGRDGETPLHSAAQEGHTAVVSLLLNNGADHSARGRFGSTPLHWAAYSGHLAVVDLLLKAGADPSAPARFGQAPLHLAASGGHTAVVSLLLEKGADHSASAIFRQTPLHLAAFEGHIAVVSLLLEKGADHSELDRDGHTPLSRASDSGHATVVKLLLEKGAEHFAEKNGRTPLHRAAYLGHTVVVSLLLESGADYSAVERGEYTPLHWAAYSGHMEVASMLLKKGANPSASTVFGQTPLHLAAFGRHPAMVSLLLESGADHLLSEDGGQTALHWAVSVGNEAVVELLIKEGGELKPAMG